MNKRWSANFYIVISIAAGYLLSLVVSAWNGKMTPFIVNLLNILNVVVITVLPGIVYWCFNKKEFKGFFKKINPGKWWKYLLVTPVLWSSSTYLNSRMNIILDKFGIDMIKQLPQTNETSAVIMGLLLTCVVAPLFEEIFYRGIILHLLRGYGNGAAIVITAILFALAHGSVSVFVSPLVFGLVLGIITIREESILPAIFMHLGCNFISWLLMSFEVGQSLSIAISLAMITLGAGASIWGIIWMMRNKDRILSTLAQMWTYIKNPLWLPVVANYIFTNFMNHG